MSVPNIARIAREKLDAIRVNGTYREMRVLAGPQGPRMRVDGKDVLLFAGNNYLDLASHPEVTEAAARAARDYGCAAGGSRLISGNLDLHEALERELAEFQGSEAALVFSTGYMANLGVIPALLGPGDVLVSDALNHASIVDAARLSRASTRIFPHGDIDALDAILADEPREVRDRGRVLVAVDGLYSMDGDIAPLAAIAERTRHHHAMLLIDDAHGTGTLGATGRGSLEHTLATDATVAADLIVGTLGKALGSFGAFIACTQEVRDLLVNTARSFIFSCALAPPQIAAARAALQVMRREPWRRWLLQMRAAQLRDRLAGGGVSTHPSTTHIVPVVIGDNAAAMRICEELLAAGFYAQAIRHPSVPEGTARLRVTPMATHSESDIDALADRIIECVADHPAQTLVPRAAG